MAEPFYECNGSGSETSAITHLVDNLLVDRHSYGEIASRNLGNKYMLRSSARLTNGWMEIIRIE